MILRRLHLRIWAGFLLVGLSCIAATAALVALRPRDPWLEPETRASVELALADLPPSGDPRLQPALKRLSDRLGVDVTVRGPTGEVEAVEGRVLPQRPPGRPRGEGGPRSGEGPPRDHGPHRDVMRVRLADGRVVVLAAERGPDPWDLPLLLLVIGGVTAVGCLPIARGITRRLERVQAGMDAWGRGELSVRVPVEGGDEVAAVARSFNAAADRVQRLVESQRRVLASASHELRSPLARVRMALDLLAVSEGPRPDLVEGAARDVEELDRTVGDLLRVGRAQVVGVERVADVDLAEVLAEEAAHVGAIVSGPSKVVRGDRDLLKRLVRNLLENAVRHGGRPVEAFTTPDGLCVADRGPGVPDAEKARIFEPFHRPGGHDEGRDGGVGLGLWLVREIAAAHGATVTVRDREGGGAVFEVRFGAGTASGRGGTSA